MTQRRNVKDFYPSNGLFEVNPAIREAYYEDGIIILRNFFTKEECKKVKNSFLQNADRLEDHCWQLNPYDKLWMWNQPGNDVTGMVARSNKVVSFMEQLLEGEVYHYFSLAVNKKGKNDADKYSYPWHQDYAHWYKYGCLTPDMVTMYMCLDEVNEHNGAIRAWLGSTRMGRLDHKEYDGLILGDRNRVQTAIQKLSKAVVELKPGDIFIRNCNLLHGSGPKTTGDARVELLVTYNKAENSPVLPHHHHTYNPINKVPDSDIINCTTSSLTGKEFLDRSSPQEVQDELKLVGFH